MTTIKTKTIGTQGPPGAQGPDGPQGSVGPQGEGATSIQGVTAGQTIGGDKLVWVDTDGKAYLASQAAGIAGKVLGISKTAVVANATFEVLTAGDVTLSGLTPGSRYYVGTAGDMTTSPPASGLFQQVGVAVTATKFSLALGIPIVRP